jgi:hypothetical protein
MNAHNSRWSALLIAVTLIQGCNRPPSDPVQRRANEYVEIATAIGAFRPGEVDAYFGPDELDRRNDRTSATPTDLLARAKQLAVGIGNDPQFVATSRGQRLQFLADNLAVLLEVLTANPPPPFAEEMRRLYGLDMPAAADMSAQLDELDALLSGSGALAFKLASLQNQLVIPAAKREAVFRRALEECRRRTARHWKLPDGEQLAVEFTREVEAAWYRYEGGGRGKLQVNPRAVAFVGTSLDVACHEGYPGHHAQFLLFERNAQPSGLPIEERVTLLRGADSVLREGAANYGVSLAWTPEERLIFERDVLFPLAGLLPDQAARAGQVHRVLTQLGDATVPILQEYRDKVISFNTATFRLEREAMVGSPAALLKFVDRHGAYVAGYTVARNRLAELIDRQSQMSDKSPWLVLEEVVAEPDIEVLKSPLPAAAAAEVR